ncbi:MAG: phospholipase A2 [Acidimicrobiales bacterium]
MFNGFLERLAAATIAILVALGVVAVTPAVVGAEVDNCTAVPDAGSTFDFTAACGEHDGCYVERPNGDSRDGRKQCDRDFRASMLGWCDDNWPTRSDWQARAECKGVAWLYYYGVRVFGGVGWQSGADASVA